VNQTEAPTLLDPIVAHCFFGRRCSHTESAFDPTAVHDAMEAHYRAEHMSDIDSALGLTGRERRAAREAS
jgi:hypothetical protein